MFKLGYWRLAAVALDALHNELFRLIEQGSCFRHRIDGFSYHRIDLDRNSLRVLITEPGSVHLTLKLLLDPGVVLGPFGLGERGLLFLQVLVEFIEHASIRLPALRKLYLIPRSKPLGREVEE